MASILQTNNLIFYFQKNSTSSAAVSDTGPWRMSAEELPVLVGSIAGVVVLLLLVLILSVYTCIHRKQTHKDYSKYLFSKKIIFSKNGTLYIHCKILLFHIIFFGNCYFKNNEFIV